MIYCKYDTSFYEDLLYLLVFVVAAIGFFIDVFAYCPIMDFYFSNSIILQNSVNFRQRYTCILFNLRKAWGKVLRVIFVVLYRVICVLIYQVCCEASLTNRMILMFRVCCSFSRPCQAQEQFCYGSVWPHRKVSPWL